MSVKYSFLVHFSLNKGVYRRETPNNHIHEIKYKTDHGSEKQTDYQTNDVPKDGLNEIFSHLRVYTYSYTHAFNHLFIIQK